MLTFSLISVWSALSSAMSVDPPGQVGRQPLPPLAPPVDASPLSLLACRRLACPAPLKQLSGDLC